MLYQYKSYVNHFQSMQENEKKIAHLNYDNLKKNIKNILEISSNSISNHNNEKNIPEILSNSAKISEKIVAEIKNIVFTSNGKNIYTRLGKSKEPSSITDFGKWVVFSKKLPDNKGILDFYFDPINLIKELGQPSTISLKIKKNKLVVNEKNPQNLLCFLNEKYDNYLSLLFLFLTILLILFFTSSLNEKNAKDFYKNQINDLVKKLESKTSENKNLLHNQSIDLEKLETENYVLKTEKSILIEQQKRNIKMGESLLRSLNIMIDFYDKDSIELLDIHDLCVECSNFLSLGIVPNSHIENFSLSDLVNDAIKLFSKYISKNNLVVEIEKNKNDFSGDKFLLKIIIINYLGRLILRSVPNSKIYIFVEASKISISGDAHPVSERQKNIINGLSSIFYNQKSLSKLSEISGVLIDETSIDNQQKIIMSFNRSGYNSIKEGNPP